MRSQTVMMVFKSVAVAVAALSFGYSSHRQRQSPRHQQHRVSVLAPLQLALKPGEKCKYGKKQHWDIMYETGHDDGRPSERYSWYCGWGELEPFWSDLVGLAPSPESDSNNNKKAEELQTQHILIAGIGNDPTPVAMYDAGYKHMTAFDYSLSGIRRAEALFGPNRRDGVQLLHADFTKLPLEDGTVDATLDKGTLDAVQITGPVVFAQAVRELGRVTKTGGVVVCVSNVVTREEWLDAFGAPEWEVIHDGDLAFSSDGAATINLGASLYSFRRTIVK